MKQVRRFLTVLAITLFMTSAVFAQETAVTVTETGNVGIGTTNPEAGLHLVGANDPPGGVIVEAAEEDRAFIYFTSDTGVIFDTFRNSDARRLPVLLQPNGGRVGIGTTSPGEMLSVAGNGVFGSLSVALTNDQRGAYFTATPGDFNHAIYNNFSDIDGEGQWDGTKMNVFDGLNIRVGGLPDNQRSALFIDGGGNVGIGTVDPDHPLTMGSGAHVTAGGVWTDASSRDYKENVQNLTLDEALAALEALEPVQYTYKVDPEDHHLGFIAEDVPDLVASKNRKGMSPMDVVAVLTKVVQQQQQQIAELQARLDAQR